MHSSFLLPCTFISIAILNTQCSSLLITYPTTSTSFPGLSLLFPPLSLSFSFFHFSFFSSFVTPHIHRSIHFPVPSSTPMSLPRTSVPVLTLFCTPSPGSSPSFSCRRTLTRHSLPVLPSAPHYVGDFRVQFSIIRQRRSQVCECLHSVYCISL